MMNLLQYIPFLVLEKKYKPAPSYYVSLDADSDAISSYRISYISENRFRYAKHKVETSAIKFV